MGKYKVLKNVFGYDDFRAGQAEIIDSILSGRDTLAVMPTGGGKSICFQIPALMTEGITVVISPLVSLMKDQVGALVENGVRAAYINSSLSESQIFKAIGNARLGMYKIIYVAPERLSNPYFRSIFNFQRLSLLCVDEAHCVSQWGQDFRPSYLEIKRFTDTLSEMPVICALTATATKRVREDIIRLLGLQSPFVSVQSFDRKNLFFSSLKPKSKPKELRRILDMHKGKSAIVYCSTRKRVDSLYEILSHEGYSVAKYHAGMDKEDRVESQDLFIKDKREIMIATNAFGMGIDKSNVYLIVHYNMPGDIESYYQEAGRAGRDGGTAHCILLHNGQDIVTQRYFIENGEENENLTKEEREHFRTVQLRRLNAMADYASSHTCLRKFILNYFGEKAPDDCGFCGNCTEVPVLRSAENKKSTPALYKTEGEEYDSGLFERLRTLRKKIADEKGVPAFIVFTDVTLRHMCKIKPVTKEEFITVSGVGGNKLQLYGEIFTKEIRNYLNLLK